MNDLICVLLLSEKQKRRVRLLENLLAGKKTVATLYWALRYGLLNVLGIGRYLGVDHLNVEHLFENGLAVRRNQQVLLTEKGSMVKRSLLKELSPETKNSLDCFQQVDLIHFKMRVQLFIQIISEYSHKNKQYYVISAYGPDKQFVKQYFEKIATKQVGKKLHEELSDFLETINQADANQFALQLVGYKTIGKTLKQVARNNAYNMLAAKIADLNTYAKLSEFCLNGNDSLIAPLLSGLNKSEISPSAKQTYMDFISFGNVELVERKRKIKESTVLEHLLEVAIYGDKDKFAYHLILSEDDYRQLNNQFSGNIDDWDYYDTPEDFRKKISFFKFRLFEIQKTKNA